MRHLKCSLLVRFFLFFLAVASLSVPVKAQDPEIKLGKQWYEEQTSNPELRGATGRTLVPLPAGFSEYKGGVYKSNLSRISIAMPRIAAESIVSIRESLVSARPNGTPITTHILFIPNTVGAAPETQDGVSAVVVTLLREDRPKDAELILRQFEPSTDAARQDLLQRGAAFSRITTNYGATVERVVRNRAAVDPFPYSTRTLPDAEVKSYGVSRFVVIPNDSLIEFSQVFPCGSLADQVCRAKAIETHDRFMSGVREFVLITAVQKSNSNGESK